MQSLASKSDDESVWDDTNCPYVDFSLAYGTELLVNAWDLAAENGAVAAGEVASSTAKYEQRAWQRGSLLSADANHLHRAGDYKAVRFAEPDLTIRSITVNLWQLTPAAARTVLGFQIGTQFDFVLRPPGATQDLTQDCVIEGIRWSVVANESDTGDLITGEFFAVPRDTRDYFTIGVDDIGGTEGLAP